MLILPVGDVYRGQFKEGKRHGRGECFYFNEKEKEVPQDLESHLGFENNRYQWEFGTVYSGQFAKDTRHGNGTMFHPNGDIEEGLSYVNDKLTKKGTRISRK